MSDKLNFNPESISMIDFKLLKGSVETPETFDISDVTGHEIENHLELGFSVEDNLARAELAIKIETKSSSEQTEATCNYLLVYLFRIEKMNLYVDLKDNIIQVHPALNNSLAALAYSTSRGILISRLQGTAFDNLILPVVNSSRLLAS